MPYSLTTSWRISLLYPFGLLATTNPGADIYAVPAPVLRAWAAEHRLVVLRGFALLEGEELPAFCETLGEVIAWDLNREEDRHPARREEKHLLAPEQAVPLHWDGMFAEQTPSFTLFHCDAAPAEGEGSEAIFCDTTRMLRQAKSEERALFEQVEIAYREDEGGGIIAPLVVPHPVTEEATLRFAEPVPGDNGVALTLRGIGEDAAEAFIEQLRSRLLAPDVGYAHAWKTGDMILADNHALLHGRRALRSGARRSVRRVSVR
jgi:alpha-ketoglutarate-dependent taurine dioxygenase